MSGWVAPQRACVPARSSAPAHPPPDGARDSCPATGASTRRGEPPQPTRVRAGRRAATLSPALECTALSTKCGADPHPPPAPFPNVVRWRPRANATAADDDALRQYEPGGKIQGRDGNAFAVSRDGPRAAWLCASSCPRATHGIRTCRMRLAAAGGCGGGIVPARWHCLQDELLRQTPAVPSAPSADRRLERCEFGKLFVPRAVLTSACRLHTARGVDAGLVTSLVVCGHAGAGRACWPTTRSEPHNGPPPNAAPIPPKWGIGSLSHAAQPGHGLRVWK